MGEFFGLTVQDLGDFVGEEISEAVDVKRAEWCLRQAAGLVEMELAGKTFPTGKIPVVVQNVTIACASRGYINPGGYSSESADDWSGSNAPIREMGFYLTGSEKASLSRIGVSSTGIGSISVAREDLQPSTSTGYVPFRSVNRFPWYQN